MGGQLFEVYGAVSLNIFLSAGSCLCHLSQYVMNHTFHTEKSDANSDDHKGCRMVLNIRDAINEQLPIIERSEARQSFISSDVRHITRQRTRDVESSVDQTGFSHTSTEIVYGIAI
ncbi:hypothetical protein M422DRAFT_54736 [Sphaerobolus stellatus SS14]|uniref:Uncharacterized protein n=1 Tax=Sphaerobolus stellatus (strain SS14) TaxID=990650 RepID=A0A0C9UGJ5_SPHS4|nr:hypothetical protein M422DRAFT_54736 [Sphaerobolus stellatus SS14]